MTCSKDFACCPILRVGWEASISHQSSGDLELMNLIFYHLDTVEGMIFLHWVTGYYPENNISWASKEPDQQSCLHCGIDFFSKTWLWDILELDQNCQNLWFFCFAPLNIHLCFQVYLGLKPHCLSKWGHSCLGVKGLERVGEFCLVNSCTTRGGGWKWEWDPEGLDQLLRACNQSREWDLEGLEWAWKQVGNPRTLLPSLELSQPRPNLCTSPHSPPIPPPPTAKVQHPFKQEAVNISAALNLE